MNLPSPNAYLIDIDGFRFDIALVETERLLLHEETISSNLEAVLDDIKRSGVLKTPVIVDRDSLVVLDGMHRVEALRRLNCRFTCVCLVEYMSPEIKVDRWCRVGSTPIDITEFGSKFGEPEVITEIGSIPSGGSSFLVRLEDGYFQLSFSGLEVFSLLKQVASIETWLSENDIDVRYETETDAVGLIERREIGFVLCPPVIQKRHVVEAAMSGRMFIPKSTCHIVPARPIGVNVPLNLLRDKSKSIEAANRRLLEILRGKTLRKVSPGNRWRQRRYDEALYIFE